MVALGIGFRWPCTSFSCHMASHQLSEHLWNAAMFVVAALVALAADRIATSSPRSITPGSLDVGALGEIADFINPIRADSTPRRYSASLPYDPLDTRGPSIPQPDVASQAGTSTVRSSQPANRLTAVLVADDRRVAVIDDAMVRVGDVLRDGARVTAIQRDRVFIVERNGRWRTLTLTNLEPGGAR
jgi:hypothetical protein